MSSELWGSRSAGSEGEAAAGIIVDDAVRLEGRQ